MTWKFGLIVCILLSILIVTSGNDIRSLDFRTDLRVLIVTVDSRELVPELHEHTPYTSLAAVINWNFAKKHGYDFKYLRDYIDLNETRRKYNIEIPADEPDEGKDYRSTVTAYHPGLKEYRGATWSKLPVLWHIAVTMASKYDLIMYLDSDAVITAAKGDRNLQSALIEWNENSDDRVTWGVKDLSKAGMIFFTNFPFGHWEPCPGALIFRPDFAAPMLKDWWDYDSPETNFVPMHEEGVLWKIFQWEDQEKYALNQSATAMVNEHQFPPHGDHSNSDKWCLEEGWICHLMSFFWGADRERIFRKIMGAESVLEVQGDHPRAKLYREAMADIMANEKQVNTLLMAEEMEKLAPVEPLRQRQRKASAQKRSLRTKQSTQ